MKKVAGILLMSLILCGIVYAIKKPQDMTREEKNKLLVESAIIAVNDRDWAFMSKLYSPRFVQHHPGNNQTTSWTDYELRCRSVWEKLPTARTNIQDLVVEGDKVAVRWKTVMNYKEKGRAGKTREAKIELTGIDLFRIQGGRIVEVWCEHRGGNLEQRLRDWALVKGIVKRQPWGMVSP